MNSVPTIELLHLLADGGLHPPAELARQLGLSEALVTAMIEDLTRRGYLAPVGQTCGIACESCGLKQACSSAPTLLALTPKGRRAVEGASTNWPRIHE